MSTGSRKSVECLLYSVVSLAVAEWFSSGACVFHKQDVGMSDTAMTSFLGACLDLLQTLMEVTLCAAPPMVIIQEALGLTGTVAVRALVVRSSSTSAWKAVAFPRV